MGRRRPRIRCRAFPLASLEQLDFTRAHRSPAAAFLPAGTLDLTYECLGINRLAHVSVEPSSSDGIYHRGCHRHDRGLLEARYAPDRCGHLISIHSRHSDVQQDQLRPFMRRDLEGCLFCLRKDGGFVSREHIFSEAFGNIEEKVLPPGVVCDRCNNGPLALADEELINFPPISLLRAERGIPTKAGNPVESKWSNAKIRFPARHARTRRTESGGSARDGATGTYDGTTQTAAEGWFSDDQRSH
jgi:hypothetical protein